MALLEVKRIRTVDVREELVQTKKTLKSKLESACPGVTFTFSFKAVNSGIGYLNQNSQVKVGSNTFTQGKTYNVIINSSN